MTSGRISLRWELMRPEAQEEVVVLETLWEGLILEKPESRLQIQGGERVGSRLVYSVTSYDKVFSSKGEVKFWDEWGNLTLCHRMAKKVNENNLPSCFYFQNTSNHENTCVWLSFLCVVIMKAPQGFSHAREALYSQITSLGTHEFSRTIFENLAISDVIFEGVLSLIKTPHIDHHWKLVLPLKEHRIGPCLH